jgi:hypothetical protein
MYLLWELFVISPSLTRSFTRNGMFVLSGLLCAVTGITTTLILEIEVKDLEEEKAIDPSASWLSKLFHASAFIANTRAVGTRWEAKNTPPHPAYLTKRATTSSGGERKLNTRLFLLRQLCIMAWEYMFTEMFYLTALQVPEEQKQIQYGRDKEWKLLDATADEWGTRLSLSLIGWCIGSSLLLDLNLRASQLFRLAIGAITVEEARPYFNSLGDLYTLRGFWG